MKLSSMTSRYGGNSFFLSFSFESRWVYSSLPDWPLGTVISVRFVPKVRQEESHLDGAAPLAAVLCSCYTPCLQPTQRFLPQNPADLTLSSFPRTLSSPTREHCLFPAEPFSPRPLNESNLESHLPRYHGYRNRREA